MRIQLLLSFLDIVESQSITKSAERLNITQPALSKQINTLEDYLDIKLFTRNIKGTVLTKEGEIFLPFAKEIVETLDKSKISLDKLKKDEKVILGTLPNLAVSVLNNEQLNECCIFDEEKSRFLTDIEVLINLFNKDAIDMLVLEDGYKRKVSYRYEYNLFSDSIYAVVPNTKEFLGLQEISLSQLEEAEFITYKGDMLNYYKLKQIIEKENIEKYVSYNIPSLELLVQIIKNGNTCTLLPKSLVDQVNTDEILKLPLKEKLYKSISLFIRDADLYRRLSNKMMITQSA